MRARVAIASIGLAVLGLPDLCYGIGADVAAAHLVCMADMPDRPVPASFRSSARGTTPVPLLLQKEPQSAVPSATGGT